MAEPSDADGLHKLGNELLGRGDRAGAERAFERALALDPARPTTLNNLANLRRERGELQAADALYQRALALGGASAALLANAAKSALALGRAVEAAALAQRLIEAAPERELGPLLLARAQLASGEVAQARRGLEQAVARFPGSGALLAELGLCLARVGEARAGLAALETAARLLPDEPAVHANLGDARRRAGDLDGAYAALTRALALAPSSLDALEALAALQIELGECDEAAETAARASALAGPQRALDLGSMRLFALAHSDRVEPRALLAEHLRWGEAAARAWASAEEAATPSQPRPRGPKLRLVYLSPDLRDHVVARFLGPVLREHDRERFEIVLAMTSPARDRVTDALLAGCELLDLAHLPREAARARLAEARPDVLVELAGHSGDPVLQLLVPRLAPVQITYLGFPCTTGLATIDLRVTDRACDPPGCEADFSERLARLPRPPWVYLPGEAPDARPRSADARPTFGCFNRATKLSASALRLFARVLAAAPEARLLLRPRSRGSARARRRLLVPFEAAGCAARVELLEDAPSFAEALRGYHEVDVALDSYPYHGTTTSCDALLMGVPVVSLMGPLPAARVSRSLLEAVDLGELAVDDEDAFVAVASRLVSDRERLARLRAELPSRLRQGPLGDAHGLARALEAVYVRPPG